MFVELLGIVSCFELFADHTEAAFTVQIIVKRFVKLRFPEIGPEFFGYVNFGVSELPKQKITDAKLTAGANQQIRVSDFRGGKFG